MYIVEIKLIIISEKARNINYIIIIKFKISIDIKYNIIIEKLEIKQYINYEIQNLLNYL